MSFLRKLFGLGPAAPAPDEPAPEQDYGGFVLRATPYQEGGQWQLCGVVAKEVDGTLREHRFVRADRFAAKSDAVEMTFVKAKQIVDHEGKRLFA